MNEHIGGIALTALYVTLAVFALGSIFFGALTAMRREFEKHSTLYRSREQMMKVMPLAVISMYVGVFAAASMFAMGFPQGAPPMIGLQFGAMLALFVVCGFVIHNHVNLQISTRLTVYQAIAYFIEWLVAGYLISVFYKG